MRIRVGHLDINHKAGRPGPQPEVHLVHKVPQPFPLVDAKAWSAIGEPEGDGVHRRACQRRMPGGSEIPLHSAREPGIPQPEIAELYPVVVVEKLSTTNLVLKRPEPATKVQKNNGEEMVILKGRHGGLLWHERSCSHPAAGRAARRARFRSGCRAPSPRPARCSRYRRADPREGAAEEADQLLAAAPTRRLSGYRGRCTHHQCRQSPEPACELTCSRPVAGSRPGCSRHGKAELDPIDDRDRVETLSALARHDAVAIP